jgi:hypothetical protein
LLETVFSQRLFGDHNKLQWSVDALWERLTLQDKHEFSEVASAQLNLVSSATLYDLITILPRTFWPFCNEIARRRTESQLIESIKVGAYDELNNQCISGSLGAWMVKLGYPLLMHERLEELVGKKLKNGVREEEDYIFRYIFPLLYRPYHRPNLWLRTSLNQGLRRGDERYHIAFFPLFHDLESDSAKDVHPDDLWLGAFEDNYYNSQVVSESDVAADDA